jgi:hypothetical protein
MADNVVEIHYTAGEVTSAQRERMIRSRQFKYLLIFWGVGVVILVLHVLLPQVFRFFPGITWGLILQATALYLVTFAALLYIVPWMSFQFTRFWRLSLVFTFNTKSLRLAVAGKTGGLRLTWDDVTKVEEYKRVFIIYYENGARHFIVPKSAFTNPKSEARFRSLIAKVGQTKPVVPEAASKSKPGEEEGIE